MSYSDRFQLLREQMESRSLHALLDLFGQPTLLKVLRRSSHLRSNLNAELTAAIELIARGQSIATETEFATLEVALYDLKSQLLEMRQSLEKERST